MARKAKEDSPAPASDVVALNLWRNPETLFEALAVADGLVKARAPDVATGQGAASVFVGQDKAGEALAQPWAELKAQELWMLPCAFAQSDLVRAAYHLTRGDVWLPGHGKVGGVPVCPLKRLGRLGPDRRDIHDGFALSQSVTPYPALWGHDASAVMTLAQAPNQYLSPLASAKKGRGLRKVEDLWPLAGTLLLAERLRLNTVRLVAVRMSKPVLSNVWWPLALREELAPGEADKALALWLSSTLGLMMLLVHREETEGAWVAYKKPTLEALPVLDVAGFPEDKCAQLAAAYDSLCNEVLQPLPAIDADPVRAAIDAAFERALGLPACSMLREMLAREPVVCLKRM